MTELIYIIIAAAAAGILAFAGWNEMRRSERLLIEISRLRRELTDAENTCYMLRGEVHRLKAKKVEGDKPCERT